MSALNEHGPLKENRMGDRENPYALLREQLFYLKKRGG